jgi:hypothetical protein
MKRNALWLLVGILACGLIAAGCGDDDDDDGGDSEAISKEEFLAEGNALCAEGDAALEAAAEETFAQGAPTPQEQEAFVTDSVVPEIQSQIDAIRDLGAPEGDEDEINGILEDAEAALSDVEADPALVTGETDPFADVNQRLADYGLTECADEE